jgi:hypothetical protein
MQRVNLYLAEFRPRNEPLLANQIALICVAAFALLLALSVFSAYQNQSLAERMAGAKAELVTLEENLQRVRSKLPADNSTALERENVRLELSIERRKMLQTLLADKNLGNADGFSLQMEGLARQSLESVSLESFSLQEGGHYLEMSGRLNKAESLPIYLQNLRSEAGFSEARFGVMQIERDAQNERMMKFQIARPGDEP